jgi:hypothetical protein
MCGIAEEKSRGARRTSAARGTGPGRWTSQAKRGDRLISSQGNAAQFSVIDCAAGWNCFEETSLDQRKAKKKARLGLTVA